MRRPDTMLGNAAGTITLIIVRNREDPESIGHIQVVFIHIGHPKGGVNQRGPDAGNKDDEDAGLLRVLQQVKAQGQPGQGRHRLEQLDVRVKRLVGHWGNADENTQGHRYQRGQDIADGHPPQTDQQVPADAQIIRTIVVKRGESPTTRTPG